MSDSTPDPGLLADALGLGPEDSPFPWQERLLASILAGELPRSLDVPTGLGKTATIAIWLIARAMGARIPRRLIYVVDRRAVVDQATEEALRLRSWLTGRADLRERLGLGGGALPISTLRGQFVDNREWLEDPACPAIVVGTVDMVGSRLLFGGYGTSRKMRPYHAALLAHDSLVVLDEAHLIPPFERLLERVALDRADLGGEPEADLGPVEPLRLLSLSATGRSQGGDAFTLGPDDARHPEVGRRLRAPKGITTSALPDGVELPEEAARRAWARSAEGDDPIRCIVFTNRRDHAEAALGHLRDLAGLKSLKKGEEPTADVELLVGGRRVFERMEAANRLRQLGFLAGTAARPARPAFLFATSAGEVGVDLDADHMVCDLVAWERMVQRLGRVNRRGRGDARVEVLIEPLPDKAGEGAVAQRAALLDLLDALPPAGEGARDGSPGALHSLQQQASEDEALADRIAAASTPDPLYPALDRPTLDAWAMTSLEQHPGRAKLAPWLRGWVEERPQATLLWRTRLPSAAVAPSAARLAEFFEAAPPHASERLETEVGRASKWLSQRSKKLLKAAAKATGDESFTGLREGGVAALLRSPREDEWTPWTLQDLARAKPKDLGNRWLPGATVVLDARFGGLSRGLLDAASNATPPTADGEGWLTPAQDDAPPVRFRVRETEDAAAVVDERWRERLRLPLRLSPEGEVIRWLVVEKWRHDAATEEDRSAGRPQLLHEHQAWAADRAERLADRLGLATRARDAIVLAARIHDEGKRARRWQAAFSAPGDGVYAKTRGPLYVQRLDGYRHEFGSYLRALNDGRLAALPAEERDLVLHLVVSHHGFARPTIRTDGCDEAPPSLLTERARDVALRFERLQRRWGPWGLAWWETLLRAADQQASRDNDARDQAPAGRGA